MVVLEDTVGKVQNSRLLFKGLDKFCAEGKGKKWEKEDVGGGECEGG